jgi:hypothetical protein
MEVASDASGEGCGHPAAMNRRDEFKVPHILGIVNFCQRQLNWPQQIFAAQGSTERSRSSDGFQTNALPVIDVFTGIGFRLRPVHSLGANREAWV